MYTRRVEGRKEGRKEERKKEKEGVDGEKISRLDKYLS